MGRADAAVTFLLYAFVAGLLCKLAHEWDLGVWPWLYVLAPLVAAILVQFCWGDDSDWRRADVRLP
jgi:hypothetical protein